MKKLFCIFLLLTFIYGEAQHQEKKFSLQLSPGIGIPVGEFGKKTFSFNPDSSYGLAKLGLALNLKIEYALSNHFVVSFLIGGMLNKQDKNAFETSSTSQYTIAVHNWKALSFMLATGYRLTLKKGIKPIRLVPSLHAGATRAEFPGYSVVYNYNGTGVISGFSAEKYPMKWAFSYSGGTELEIYLSQACFVSGGIYYFNTTPLHSAKYETEPNRYTMNVIKAVVGVGVNL